MKRTVRSVLGMSAGVLLVGVSACAVPSGDSGSEQPSETAQQAKALEGFDPCTFFEPDELKSWGLPPTEGQDNTQLSWEPTCGWTGEATAIDLSKNAEETVDSYEQSGNWASYKKQEIAGRSAAIAQTPGAQSTGSGCSVLFDAGGGVVIYQTSVKGTESVDACGEAQKIAEATASRLPE